MSDRKGLNELIKYMRKGDTVITYKNDRVFHSLRNMVELIDKFNKAGVHFKSLSEPEFDTASANGKFLLHIFAGVAEFERNPISERTKVGLNNALQHEKLLFATNTSPYGSSVASFNDFVGNAEGIMSTENAGWTQIINKKEEDSETGE